LERFKSLNGELESELVGAKKHLSDLHLENKALIEEKATLEEKLLAKFQCFAMNHSGSGDEKLQSSPGNISPVKTLFAMKKAFDINEKIISKQKADIKDRNDLVRSITAHITAAVIYRMNEKSQSIVILIHTYVNF